MFFIALVVLGLVALTRLGLDYMPEMEIPAISVITSYRGAGAQEVESRITEVMEEQLSTVPKVDNVSSVSSEGLSMVVLQFDWGVNLDEAASDIRDKVGLAKGFLPDEADEPVIFKFDLAMMPVMVIGVTAQESWEKLDKIVDDKITEPLKRVPGVATAIRRGGLEREIQVYLDRDRLRGFGLSTNEIIQRLAAENLSNPGGHLKMGDMDYLVRTPEEYSSPEEIKNLVITYRNGTPIYLGDVASVGDAFEETNFEARIDGKRGMAVLVQKQSGENTVEVAKRVSAELEKIKADLPPDVQLKMVYDASEFIRETVRNLRDTLLWAGLFVFLVVLFFLRNPRASLIIITSIPTSLIVTFLLMHLAGYTLNIVSLSSLVIVIGMVVDNAIVVLDNIHRHREQGERPAQGAIFGTSEVGVAVMASTLTTVSIFLPIIFVGGITSIIFGEMAAIITMALLVSLLTALTLTPMLSSKWLRISSVATPGATQNRPHRSEAATNPSQGGRRTGGFFALSERVFTALESHYSRLLHFSITHPKSVIAGAALLLAFSVGSIRFVGTEFFTEVDQNFFTLEVELPIGTRYEKTGEVVQKIRHIMRDNIPELDADFFRWGSAALEGGPQTFGREEASYTGFGWVKLVTKTEREDSPKEIIERIRPMLERIPGAKVWFSTEDPMAGLIFGGGRLLSVELYGYDLESARDYAQRVAAALSEVSGVRDPDISRKEEKPELQVRVDRQKAANLGLNVSDIGKTVETYFSGTTATKYREAGEEYDVMVRLRQEDRERIEDLSDVFITTADGRQIKLSQLADVNLGLGPTKIERKNQGRFITVSADIYQRDLGTVVQEAEEKIAKLPRPPGFSYEFTGAAEEMSEAFRLLLLAAALGMGLVYMVMASQFESFRNPFIIFLSIPFGFVGVVWALAITGKALGVVAFIGIILLIGIVVNNGIVLISYIGILRNRGLSVAEAVVEGGRARLRPVLMTTTTTILGLTPLALSRGVGSEEWVVLAIPVMGGLAVSTLVTLVLMPTLYSVFEGRRGRKAQSK
jgi:HAE1 family hydrophobic/amphiphilic exporter-1